MHNENTIIIKVILEKNKHLLVINTYIPNEYHLKIKQMDNLEYIIEQIFNTYVNPPIVICGDFNQDLRYL